MDVGVWEMESILEFPGNSEMELAENMYFSHCCEHETIIIVFVGIPFQSFLGTLKWIQLCFFGIPFQSFLGTLKWIQKKVQTFFYLQSGPSNAK